MSTATGEQLSAPLRFKNAVLDVGFAPDDKALYVAVLGGILYKVNLPLRKAEQASHELVMGRFSPASYNADLDRIAALDSERLTVVDLKTEKEYPINVEDPGLSGGGGRFRYFPLNVNWEKEEVLFFSTTQETNVVLNRLNYKDDSIRETFEMPAGTKSARWGSFGRHLGLVSTNNVVSVMDIKSRKMIGKPFPIDDRLSTATPTGDEDLMYGQSRRSGIQFYNINSGAKVGPSIDIGSASVKFLPGTRKYLVYSSQSSVISVFKDRLKSITHLDLGPSVPVPWGEPGGNLDRRGNGRWECDHMGRRQRGEGG